MFSEASPLSMADYSFRCPSYDAIKKKVQILLRVWRYNGGKMKGAQALWRMASSSSMNEWRNGENEDVKIWGREGQKKRMWRSEVWRDGRRDSIIVIESGKAMLQEKLGQIWGHFGYQFVAMNLWNIICETYCAYHEAQTWAPVSL